MLWGNTPERIPKKTKAILIHRSCVLLHLLDPAGQDLGLPRLVISTMLLILPVLIILLRLLILSAFFIPLRRIPA